VLGKSGAIGTMVRSNGLAWIPPEKEGVEAGEEVLVRLLGPITKEG
jgi:molybdopterin molybdotransferase